MSMHTAMLATLIVMLGAAQYALYVQALRDLARRPRVRGDNKVLWGLCIICIPVFGALYYNWMGPTSFVGRRAVPDAPAPDEPIRTASNITSIATARAARRKGTPAATQATRPQPPARPSGNSSPGSRTGS